MSDGFSEMMSQMRFYSIGIVARDKPKDSNFIDVWPAEQHPFVDGDIASTKDVLIQAKWIRADNTQRITPPDVCAKESVHIYRYADSDRFFWMPAGYEPGLRKKETIIYVVSNNPSQASPTEAPDISNQVFFMISSDSKTFHFHTPTNDGEKVGMDLFGDWNKGIFTYKDTNDNILNMDGEANKFTARIQSEIVVMAKDKISVQTKNVQVQCEQADVVATTGANITTPELTQNGNLVVNGDVQVNGDYNGTGNIDIGGVGNAAAWIP